MEYLKCHYISAHEKSITEVTVPKKTFLDEVKNYLCVQVPEFCYTQIHEDKEYAVFWNMMLDTDIVSGKNISFDNMINLAYKFPHNGEFKIIYVRNLGVLLGDAIIVSVNDNYEFIDIDISERTMADMILFGSLHASELVKY